MRSIDFWKAKLEAAEKELKGLLTPALLPGLPPKRKRFRNHWPRVRHRWVKQVKELKENTFKTKKLRGRINYYKQRIDALRSLPRAARALRSPPI